MSASVIISAVDLTHFNIICPESIFPSANAYHQNACSVCKCRKAIGGDFSLHSTEFDQQLNSFQVELLVSGTASFDLSLRTFLNF